MRRTSRIAAMSGSAHLGHNRVPNQLRAAARSPASTDAPRRPLGAGSLLLREEAGDGEFEALTFTEGQPWWPFGYPDHLWATPASALCSLA
jgi:hypothetical protein